jgi:AcrR family transcriptional regulator
LILSRGDVSSSEPAGGGRRAKAAQTEVALKEAALRVFAVRGYAEAKITDITSEAHRSVGTFYKHFDGKEQILQALLVDWVTEAGDDLATSDAGDDLSLRPALRARVAAYWQTYRAHQPEIRALREAAQSNPSFAEQLAGIRHTQLQTMRKHLTRLQAHGYQLAGDPAVLASAFDALLEGCCAAWIGGTGELMGRTPGDDEAIDTLTDLLHRGLVAKDD